MQVLRNTPALRLIQIADLGAALVLTVLASVTFSYLSNRSNLYPIESIEAVERTPSLKRKYDKIIILIHIAFRGALFTSIICLFLAIFTSLAAAFERRRCLYISTIVTLVVAVFSFVIMILVFATRSQSDVMIFDLFNVSVNEYTNSTDPYRGLIIRRFVDRIQSESGCCGVKSYREYRVVFERFSAPFADPGNYAICVQDTFADQMSYGPQEIPMSCCKDYVGGKGGPNFRCLVKNYSDWSLPDCKKPVFLTADPTIYEEGCGKDKTLSKFTHGFIVTGILLLMILIVLAGITAFNVVLWKNIISPKENTVELLKNEFDLTKTQVERLQKDLDVTTDATSMAGGESNKIDSQADALSDISFIDRYGNKSGIIVGNKSARIAQKKAPKRN